MSLVMALPRPYFVFRLEASVMLSRSSVIPELYVCDESSAGRPTVPE
jgi:hypothetical protein